MEISGNIFSLGNSHAIRLPRIVMEALALKADDPITLEVVGQRELLIRKQIPSTHPSIWELMAGWKGERPTELESAGAVGRKQI